MLAVTGRRIFSEFSSSLSEFCLNKEYPELWSEFCLNKDYPELCEMYGKFCMAPLISLQSREKYMSGGRRLLEDQKKKLKQKGESAV